MVAVMAKRRSSAKIREEVNQEHADSTEPTTIRVSTELRTLVIELAKLKRQSAADMLDEMLIAKIKEDIINAMESRVAQLRQK